MSDIASLIADMVRQGVDPDLIGRTAAVLAERAVDTQAERRRAKDRERKAYKAANFPRNSAESAEQRIPPKPPKKNTPIPPLKGGTSPTILEEPQPEKPTSAPAKPLSAWVSEIWEITPRPGRERSGKPRLETSLRAAIRRGADPAAIKRGCEGYYATDDATKSHGQFAQGVHTVISSGRWETFAETMTDDPPPDDDPWRRRLLNWSVNQYWNSDWGPKPGKPGYRGPGTESLAA